MPKRDIEDFISHWSKAELSENQISQPFLVDLCDLLDMPQPDNRRNGSYSFEFHVSEPQHDGTTKEGRIDLYKRACFILESKKFQEKPAEQSQLELAAKKFGAISKRKKNAAPVRDTERWDDAMLKALVQAERYTRALPADEPYPPFVLVVDVGHVIEVRADFSLTGRAYQHFPDTLNYRIRLEQLRDEKIRERLKLIWTNPAALDPSHRSAEVTREVAKHLAELAKSFEKQNHPPKIVAEFLTRCLFCMFAEDVGLLPDKQTRGFTELLESLPASGEGFVEMLRTLFKEMNEGRKNEISVILRKKLLKFNGGLFADNTVLPVNGTQLGEGFKLEMESITVDPHQFLGLEINPRAVSIAELVLWIGYLQWHFRTRGQTMPAEPVLKKFNNIQRRDAVLEYDGEPQPERDAAGNEKTVWDKRSTASRSPAFTTSSKKSAPAKNSRTRKN